MRWLLLTGLAFAVAVAINTANVAAEQRWHVLTRRFGRFGLYIHLGLVTPGYACFLLLLRELGGHVRWKLPGGARPLGAALLGLAVLLWLDAYHQLGAVRVANGDIFGWTAPARLRRGIFRWLRDPMYDSYALALLGFALWSANAAYLPLAAESLLLLNVLEATVENRGLPSV